MLRDIDWRGRNRNIAWNAEGLARFQAIVLLGFAALPFAGSLWITYAFVSTYEGPHVDFRLAALAQLGCAILGTAAFAPLQIASVRLLEGSPTFKDALAEALVLAARRPALTAVLGSLQGALVSAPMWTFSSLRSWLGLSAFPIAFVVTCAGAAAAVGLLPGLSSPSDAPVGRLRWVAVTPILAIIAAVVLLLAVEPPALTTGYLNRRPPTESEGILEAQRDSSVWLVRDGRRTPFRVARPASVVLITATDPSASPLDSYGYRPATSLPPPDGAMLACDRDWSVCAYFGPRWVVRDAPRLAPLLLRSTLLSWTALVAAATAAFLIARGLWRLRRASIVRPSEATTTRARLRFTGAPLAVERSIATTPHDGIVLETADGELVARHHGPLLVLGDATFLADGVELWLVTPTPLSRVGPRTGAVQVPRGSWVALAKDSPESAFALRTARMIAMPSAVLLVSSLLAVSLLLMLL